MLDQPAVARTSVVPVKLPNGAIAAVEITARASEATVSGGAGLLNADNLGPAIEGYARLALDALKAVSPKKCELELNFAVTLEGGALTALLVKGNADASIKLTLIWET